MNLKTYFIALGLLSMVTYTSTLESKPRRTPPLPHDDCGDRRCKKLNEVWLDCGAYCEPTCGKLYEECKIRFIRCPDGCHCAAGYARDPKTKSCVKESQCPDYKQCKKNEVYKPSGLRCQESCDKTLCSLREEIGSKGCFCDDKSARIDGKCVSREKCECPKHMVYFNCGNACTDACHKELMDCMPDCKPGCICAGGYRRVMTEDDSCIHMDECAEF